MRRLGSFGLALTVGVAAFVLASAAQAQVTGEQQSAIRASCRSDFMSKCSGVTPGGKDALMCLQKNVASLAPACKTAVSATIPAAQPAAETKPAQPAPAPAAAAAPPPPATPAAAAAPPAPKPGQATIIAAPPPRAALPTRSAAPKPQQVQPAPAVVTSAAPAADAAPAPTAAQLKAVSFSCRRDLSANCRGVPNGAESIACLRRNAGKLAPDCKTSLAAIADTAPLAPAAPGTPPATRAPNAPVVMTAVIGRACLRDLALHCRNTGIGDGQKIACLIARGDRLAPLCKAALKITGPVR
jgi:hypothetical protein